MLDFNKPLKWTKLADGFKVKISESLSTNLRCKETWTLKIEALNR